MNSYNDSRSRVLARSATEAKQYNIRMKLLRILSVSISVLLVLIYVVSVLYSKYGSFTVSVSKFDGQNYSLLLSESGDFDADGTTRLHCDDVTDITNISTYDLPADLDSQNGNHNGENYLAYSFYFRNGGKDTITYEYYLYIANCTNNVDKAIRIRLYRDGEDVTYARTKSDGTGPEENTTEFVTKNGVARVRVPQFAPGDTARFTVVIWLEGADADCTDDLIGGMLKCDMKISAVSSGADDVTEPSDANNQ